MEHHDLRKSALATEVVVGVSAFAALAADIEEVVNPLAAEVELGALSQKTADDVSALVRRAHQLADDRLALLASRSPERLIAKR